MTAKDIKRFVEKQSWIFAKTYASRAPHEYIVRGKCAGTDEDFDGMIRYIEEQGITMHFWGHPNKYVFLGDKYYWVMKGANDEPIMVINRARIEDYHITITWKGNAKA